MLMLYEYMNNGNCNIFFQDYIVWNSRRCYSYSHSTRKMLVIYVPQCVCDLLNKQRIHICFLQVLVIIY